MIVFNPSKRAVNPVLLAIQTGITKPNYGIRAVPFNGLNGMGDVVGTVAQFDPEPISRSALTLITAIESAFGIGSGRKEADIIVPIQNQVFDTILKPIIDAVNLQGPTMTYETLQSLWNSLETAKAKWLAFLHQPWPDGRAAQQAEATLAPYWNDAETKIQALLQTAPHGGTGGLVGGVVTSPPPSLLGGVSTPVLIGIGLLAVMLLMSGKSKGL